MKRKLFSRGFVCAFPGTGKSTIVENQDMYGIGGDVFVHDTIQHAWKQNRFLSFYISRLEAIMLTRPNHLVFVSSSELVRNSLKQKGLKYDLAFPNRELKSEYLERYKKMGMMSDFIEKMDEHWDEYIDSCENDQTVGRKYRLESGQYLSDVLM